MDKKEPKRPRGLGMATGISLGAGIGIILDNLAIGIAVGVAMGLGFEFINSKKNQEDWASLIICFSRQF